MAALVLFVSFTAIVFLTGYHWRGVATETAGYDKHETRLSLLRKI